MQKLCVVHLEYVSHTYKQAKRVDDELAFLFVALMIVHVDVHINAKGDCWSTTLIQNYLEELSEK